MPMLWSLFDFKMKMVGAPFPRCNIVLMLGAALYIFVMYLMESDPRCFRGNRQILPQVNFIMIVFGYLFCVHAWPT